MGKTIDWFPKWPQAFSTCFVVQLLNYIWFFATPWTVAHQAPLSSTISWVCSVMLSNYLILCHPFLLLPSLFPSIRVFFNESALCFRWPKYWTFSSSNSPSNEYSGLTSFRIDWFDLLAVQVTFKSLLQHHSSKASILQCLPFFMDHLSYWHKTWSLRRLTSPKNWCFSHLNCVNF